MPRFRHVRLRQVDERTATWLAFGCIVTAGFAYLLWKGRGNTFFYDEWSWIEFRRSGLHSILASYNGHLEPLPTAIYQALLHTIGLTHYRVYRTLAATAHCACATLAFAFARRRIGPAALLLALPVVLLGSGYSGLKLAWHVRISPRQPVRDCALA